MKYVIECVDRLYAWNFLEYQHISRIVGKENLIFTLTDEPQLAALGKTHKESLRQLSLKRVCILDPSAPNTFAPKDAKLFDYLAFGGIMGDYPPKARTAEVFKGVVAERRNLGKGQMPTDNAVYVCKRIVDGTPLSALRFQDTLTIETGEGEEVELPFTYVLVDGEPLICAELVKHLKEEDDF